ncbi:MAG: LptF/LptG family permease [Bacteroidales bacterium]|nr:LptF/LptG family permease [Bacteroidales bacterium]
MKKVDAFVLKSFIGPLIFTFFIVLIILILQFLWMYVDELAGKGLDFKVVSELLYHFAMTFVPTALPLAILLASLMTFGNMGEFFELSALKSSGIPLQRIMRPLIILIGFIAVISFFFSNNVLPYSTSKARTLLYDIRRKKPDINIQAGTFYNGVPDFSIKITTKDPVTNRLNNLIIYDHRDKRGNTSVILADSGYMKTTPDGTGLIMVLYNGYSFNEIEEKNVSPSAKKYPTRKDYFKEQTIVISLTGFDLERSEDGLFKSNSAMLNISQLTFYIDSLNMRHNERISNQFNEFNSTKIYTQKGMFKRHPAKTDAPDTIKKVVPFETRIIFDSLPESDKSIVLSRAISSLKDGTSYLSERSETTHWEVKVIKRYEVEWNRKLTMSFACLVFFFIGAPLGAIIRKGGLGTPSVISIFFFVIYYVISISGQKLVEEDVVGTFAGMWAASYILLPIGIFLTYKATTDSVIMNIETYLVFLKKIKDYIYRIAIMGNSKNSVSDSNNT